MTSAETITILMALSAAYPAYYLHQSEEEKKTAVRVWTSAFGGVPLAVVDTAVMSLIKTSRFPPTIAEVGERIDDLVSAAKNEPTDEELFTLLKNSMDGISYCAAERFRSFPPLLQQFCGSPAGLAELGRMDQREFTGVYHSNFLKQMQILRKRRAFRESMPPRLREAFAAYSASISMPEDKPEPTSEQLNARVNDLLRRISAPSEK